MHRMMSLIFSQPHHRVEGPRDAGQLRGQLRGARVLQAERRVRLDSWAVYGHAAMQFAVTNNLFSFPTDLFGASRIPLERIRLAIIR